MAYASTLCSDDAGKSAILESESAAKRVVFFAQRLDSKLQRLRRGSGWGQAGR